MHVFHELINAILIIVFIYALALILRRKGTLQESHSLTLAHIVTDLCLPAMIFSSLARQSIRLEQVAPSLVMLGLELIFIVLAWMISALLKFNKPQQGAIVFCSAFGSSTFLGYAIITQMFPQVPEALTEAVLISEVGVGYPIFILGPLLATYFGSEKSDAKSQWKASLGFFKSPVFFALIVGLLWGSWQLPGEENVFLTPIFRLFDVLASALTPLAILSVGLVFKVPKLGKIFVPLTIVILLKLILKPMFAGFLATQFAFPELWQEIMVLLSAMPPALLGVVFLKRYGGDASLASALLLAATLVSVVTIVAMFWMVG